MVIIFSDFLKLFSCSLSIKPLLLKYPTNSNTEVTKLHSLPTILIGKRKKEHKQHTLKHISHLRGFKIW